jgi:hypothetical protein
MAKMHGYFDEVLSKGVTIGTVIYPVFLFNIHLVLA